jgi:hypothetical protein
MTDQPQQPEVIDPDNVDHPLSIEFQNHAAGAASDLISGHASKGYWGHQFSDAREGGVSSARRG